MVRIKSLARTVSDIDSALQWAMFDHPEKQAGISPLHDALIDSQPEGAEDLAMDEEMSLTFADEQTVRQIEQATGIRF